MQKNHSKGVLTLYSLILGVVVFTPNRNDDQTEFIWFLQVIGICEQILNFFLLTPLPIMIYWLNQKIQAFLLIMIGPLVSLTIEILQFWIPGRVTDFRDLLLNSAGYILIAVWLIQRRVSLFKI